MEEIKKLTSDSDIYRSADIIRKAFEDVTQKFQITKENFPSYAAFITPEKLKGFKAKGGEMYGLFIDNVQTGFVAIEEARQGIYYLMKLSILPEYRHKKYGEKLMQSMFETVKTRNGKIISMAVLEDAATLKEWYIKLGFKEVRKQKFHHIPYPVCFMEKEI